MVKITGKLWRGNVDICPPIISVEKKQRQRKKSAQEFYFLIFITLHEKKGLLFVEARDSEIKIADLKCCSGKVQKSRQNLLSGREI